MRSLGNTLGRDGDLPLMGIRDVSLSARLPEYNLTRWQHCSDGPSDGDSSRRQLFGVPWRYRHALISPANSRPRRPSRSHRLNRRSLSPSRWRRRAQSANQARRPFSSRAARRQPRASPWIPSTSSASTSATQKAGLVRRINEPMHHQVRFGVISARIARSTCISISTCKKG
jgi:hypothetical protein